MDVPREESALGCSAKLVTGLPLGLKPVTGLTPLKGTYKCVSNNLLAWSNTHPYRLAQEFSHAFRQEQTGFTRVLVPPTPNTHLFQGMIGYDVTPVLNKKIHFTMENQDLKNTIQTHINTMRWYLELLGQVVSRSDSILRFRS